MPEILVISDDVVGPKMAGPGIRAWELSRVLADKFDVGLAIPDYSPGGENLDFFSDASFRIHRYSQKDPRLLENLAAESGVILIQGYILRKFPFLKAASGHLICDLYVPFPLENLFIHQKKISNLKDREFIHNRDLEVFNDQFLHGDHFLCANVRQKDLFMGSLLSLNRVNPRVLDSDPDLQRLISVVPFGIRNTPETPGKSGALTKLFPRIQTGDLVMIWGGVLTNWFDPLTLIHAVADVVKTENRIKLVFLSTGHPNPLLPEFDMARESRRLSDDLGLTDSHVFFHPEWVDYESRGDYFRDANIGISIHRTHFETYYSFRTRILDYIRFKLPIICTEGDTFADLVIKKSLGRVVLSGDAAALTKAILEVSRNEELRASFIKNIEMIEPGFHWEKVAEPLVQYCHETLREGLPKKIRNGNLYPGSIPDTRNIKRKKWRRFLWKPFQKLPLSLSSKLKRWLKFLDK